VVGRRRTLVIGLTGGIGTGKSEVSLLLKELGAKIINADHIGHEAYMPHTQVWREVVSAFGEGVLKPNGEIDRKKLGDIVFHDPSARARLNAIMHPRMYRMLEERIEELRRRGVEVVVVEAALLIEGGWYPLVDEVWVTYAPEEVVLQRLRERSGLSEEEAKSRIRSQLPFEERAKYATVVIDNSGSLEELRRQVELLWERRVKGRG
jgi:dephospho-CoA kinase